MSQARNRDIASQVSQHSSIRNESYSGGGDINGDGVDTVPGQGQEFLSAQVFCEIWGGTASDEIVFVVQESTDDGSNDSYEDLTDKNGDRFEVTLEDAEGDGVIEITNAVYERHLRVIVDDSESTVDTSTNVHATVTLGGAMEIPV